MSKRGEESTIPILTDCIATEEKGFWPPPPSQVASRVVSAAIDVGTEVLAKNLSEFVARLSRVVEAVPSSSGRYSAEEFTFSLSVNGEGRLSLIGEVSAGVVSGVTVTLKKK
jgi:hypothetical protein